MKLHSSSPPPSASRHHHRNRRDAAGFCGGCVRASFPPRTAWWVFVVIVAVFAITIVRMFRHMIELAPQ